MLKSSSIVRQFPEVVPEHLFVQIPEQMELFHARVSSLEAALEQAPEVFESVSVNLSVNVLFGVVNDLVLESLFPESLIRHERIGVDRTPRFDVGTNGRLESVFFATAYNRPANFSTAFQNADDGHFVFCAGLSNPALTLLGVHEASGTANESFVYFDLAPTSAEFQYRTILHCEPDAVKHEPCGLLSHTESASDFIGADAVLAVRNHPNSDKPFVERKCGILKDSSDFARKLFAGVLCLAFPHAPSRDKANVFTSASWAFDAIGPAALNHEVEAVVSVSEVQDGLLECSWLFHGVPHTQNCSRNALLSQVYYYPCKSVSK